MLFDDTFHLSRQIIWKTDRKDDGQYFLYYVKSLEEWRPFIHGSKGGVIVYTDNHACTYLMTQKEVKGRKHINWLGALADYGDELNIKHISGDRNRVADALSRVVSAFGTAGSASSKRGVTVNLVSRRNPTPICMIVEQSFRQIKSDIAESYKLVPWTAALVEWCQKGKLSLSRLRDVVLLIKSIYISVNTPWFDLSSYTRTRPHLPSYLWFSFGRESSSVAAPHTTHSWKM